MTSRRARTSLTRPIVMGLLVGPAMLAGCLKVPDDEIVSPDTKTAPSTAQEILDRYVTAMGGEEALRALKQRTVDAKIVLHPIEGCPPEDPACSDAGSEGSFLLQTTADGRMYRRMVIEGQKGEGAFDKARGLVSERGFDGKQGWEVQASTPPLLLLEAKAQEVISREDALLHWYFDHQERGVAPEIQSPREIEVDGKTIALDGLVWKIPGTPMPPRVYWFDRATGLLHEEIETDATYEDTTRSIIYTDYREVDGVQVPFHIEQIAQSGEQKQRIDLIVSRVDHGEIARPLFAIPELPPAQPMPDERLQILADAREAAKEDPSDATTAIAWARAAWGAAHFDEALEAAAATLKADPREPEALYLQGRIHAVTGDIKAARKAYAEAGRAGVSPPVILHQLGMLDLRGRDAVAAAKKFADAGEQGLAERWQAAGSKLLDAKWGGNGCSTEIPLLPDFVAPAIEVELEGEKLRLLVDSSVPGVVISQQRALKMLISTDAQSALGPQGPAIGHGSAEQLKVGDLTLSNVPVDMYPPELIADVAQGRELDGVIGIRAFEQSQLTIDPGASQLQLVKAHKKCKKQLEAGRQGPSAPFWVHDDHMIFVMAMLNDTEGVYLVNTAMRGAGLAATVGAFARAGTSSPVIRADQPGAFVDVEHVKIGGVDFGATRGAWGWAEQQAPDQFRVDGMIGIEAIGRRRWTMDFEQQRFYFGEPSEPAPKSESKPAPKAESKSKSEPKPESKPESKKAK